MTVIQLSLFQVAERFSAHRNAIERLFKADENFQTLCEDYQLCAETLERWNKSTSKAAPAYRREYAELLGELESEISAYLGLR